MSQFCLDQCTCDCHRQPASQCQPLDSHLIFKKPIVITIPRTTSPSPFSTPSAAALTYQITSDHQLQLQHEDRHVHFESPSPSANRIGLTYNQTSQKPQPRSILRTLPVPVELLPSVPTIYIVTYAKSLTPTLPSINTLLNTQIPHRKPPIPYLYTLDCSSLPIPPASLCEKYSGISLIMQDIVSSNPTARQWIKQAVGILLDFGAREREKPSHRRGDKDTGRREVAMSVCCESGTHRSVAIAERIAQGVKDEVGRLGNEEGVKIVCRHVHRAKGPGDPF